MPNIHTIIDRLNYFQFDRNVISEIFQKYQEPHRHFHTLDHVIKILDGLEHEKYQFDDALFLTAVFHDVIYDPRSQTNEEDSAAYFLKHFKASEFNEGENLRDSVIQMIRETIDHNPTTEMSKLFCKMDMAVLDEPFPLLMRYEDQIFKEFQFADWKIYRHHRIEALKKFNNPNLQPLISYVANRKPKIAIYPGSFNPFHKGHENILLKAEKIFDKVIIARGINPTKGAPTWEMPTKLEFHQVVDFSGLLTEYIKSLNYDVTVIRGLRNTTDLQYELTQYRFLQDLMPEINVVSIFCDKEFEHISSSTIRDIKTIDNTYYTKFLL
jgi:pantetheine-phosphate adenylyltransferase